MVGSSHRTSGDELEGDFSLFFSLCFELVQADEVAVEDNLITSADMRPISKAVKLVVAVRPISIRFTLVLSRAVPPATATCIANDAYHVAVTRLKFGIVIHVRHNKRSEDAILLCRLGDVSQSTGIAFATIATADDTHTAVFAVFVPREEVHTDEFNAEFFVVLEESVDVFFAAGILSHSPVEPFVFRAGVHYLSRALVV